MQPRRVSVPPRLGIESVEALATEIDAINADASVSVIVLEGGDPAADGAVFCAGLNTDELLETPDEGARRRAVEGYQRILRGIRLGPKATLALVDAPVLGGGVGITSACDYVLASERASFAFPEALFGLIPAMVMPLALERMRPQQARLWALSAASRPAQEALEAGLIDQLVASEKLERAAKRAIRQLGRARPAGVAELATFTARALELPLTEALAEGGEITLAASGDPEVSRALNTFREHGVLVWDENEEA